MHVVIAVIKDPVTDKFLIAKRHDNKPQGGKWEFAGGKVEHNEPPQQALIREVDEELGLQVEGMEPLIKISYQYTGRSILLDVYTVTQYSGTATGREGQEICWVTEDELSHFSFPEANKKIIQAIKLPLRCLITPEPSHSNDFLSQLELVLNKGIKLVQFRAKKLESHQYIHLAKQVINLCHHFNAQVLLNNPPHWIETADGLHLTSQQLQKISTRPEYLNNKLLSAACHNEKEVFQAKNLDTDLIFLSPVKTTQSHPEATPMGWEQFSLLVEKSHCPIYALGGLDESDIVVAKQSGAQGIAGISAWWKSE